MNYDDIMYINLGISINDPIRSSTFILKKYWDSLKRKTPNGHSKIHHLKNNINENLETTGECGIP
jgi:hypothetical protein